MVKTLRSQCRGYLFHHHLAGEDPACLMAKKKKKKIQYHQQWQVLRMTPEHLLHPRGVHCVKESGCESLDPFLAVPLTKPFCFPPQFLQL